MLSNLFRSSARHNQQVNEEQNFFPTRVNKKNVDVDSAATTGVQGKLTFIFYFIQTNSCTLFKTHTHSHLKL
jgi:hypothetical protein